MKTADGKESSIRLDVPRAIYSREAVVISAQILSARALVYLEEPKTSWRVTLKSKRTPTTPQELDALAGEFLNEILNQEYRFLVSRFNRNISRLILTQALYCARGGSEPPAAIPEEQTPRFRAEVAALLDEARQEVLQTMPRKISHQGTPIPAQPEGVDA